MGVLKTVWVLGVLDGGGEDELIVVVVAAVR